MTIVPITLVLVFEFVFSVRAIKLSGCSPACAINKVEAGVGKVIKILFQVVFLFYGLLIRSCANAHV